MKANGNGPLIYFYGVTRKRAPAVGEVPGVDGIAPVEMLECTGLTSWISRVSRFEFADELSKNVENLDWLADMTTRHHRVISAIAAHVDILPARFGVVFSSEASLRADLESRVKALRTDFRRIEGNEEWSVKVFVSRAMAPQPRVPKKVQSGKEYLLAKAALRPRRADKKPDGLITRFALALENISEGTAEGGRISGGQRDLQFQVSLLIKRVNRRKLETVLRKFTKEWKENRRIECTGPWPPFSFVSRSSL